MTKESDNIPYAANGRLDAAARDATSFTTIFQDIVDEGADYTEKSGQARMTFVEKLQGAKSFDTASQIQSEYVKMAYAAFIAQAAKIGELYSNLAKAGFKPIELPAANMQG